MAPLGTLTEGVAVNQGYVYTLTGLPKEACADVAVGLEGLAYVLKIKNEDPITAALTVPTGTLIKDPSLPYNSATANTACAGSSDQATVSFLVPRR